MSDYFTDNREGVDVERVNTCNEEDRQKAKQILNEALTEMEKKVGFPITANVLKDFSDEYERHR